MVTAGRAFDVYAIAEAALGRTPDRVRPITNQGVGNLVWEISSKGEPFILRYNGNPEEADAFEKEAWCIAAAAAGGVPGATVVGTGRLDTANWMLQTKIEGTPGNRWKEDTGHLWREMGRLAAKLNAIPVEGYGNRMTFSGGNAAFQQKSWGETVDWFSRELFSDDMLVRSGTLTVAQSGKAQEMVLQMHDWKVRPVLCHYDILPKNVIVDPQNRMHLIDYGIAGSGPGVIAELASICAFATDRRAIGDFCHGYGIAPATFDSLQPDLSKLLLTRVLLHARWASQQESPDMEATHLIPMRAKAREIIDSGFIQAAQPAFPSPGRR